jgi:hypothetical protein
MIKLVSQWSRSARWGNAHQLALAGGALLTYVWYGFPHPPAAGSKGVVDLIGNGIFAIGAIVLLVLSAKRNSERTAHHTVQGL